MQLKNRKKMQRNKMQEKNLCSLGWGGVIANDWSLLNLAAPLFSWPVGGVGGGGVAKQNQMNTLLENLHQHIILFYLKYPNHKPSIQLHFDVPLPCAQFAT